MSALDQGTLFEATVDACQDRYAAMLRARIALAQAELEYGDACERLRALGPLGKEST